MKGIDISVYQGTVDFKKVKNSGIQIVYIEATKGLAYVNPLFKSQYAGAKAAGLKIGFYHRFEANDPILEAKHFIKIIDGLSPDCKYVIDAESSYGNSITVLSSKVRQFANYLISIGKDVCLYTGDNFYATHLDNSVKNLPLWIAHYRVTKPDVIKYIGFQYSDTGIVDGVTEFVDLDEFSSGIFLGPVPPVVVINAVVRSFQHAANLVGLKDKNGSKLVENGIIGTHTNEVIAKVYVTKGAHNELVRWIQQRLIASGFGCGPTGADSYFGLITLAAVKKYQTSKKLKSDGIVGPLTINKLLR
ncbi:GH25 family lysozyme [Clostridium psychrophilum]|uniref:GH25 family lysozyme n=1 Tax=Clostridium psychrophilum TaxID=132926 RepID=UPI001C0BAC18|nr:GH25 family lysozyme [Clostridium psychrophilum]MBU3179776.1 peptidoglycan-binding protein [Clostridium psychrophilum]